MNASFLNTLLALKNDESGQDLIEYALISAMFSLGAIATMHTLSSSINSVLTSVKDTFDSI